VGRAYSCWILNFLVYHITSILYKVNGALCRDCNIIIYLQWKIVGRLCTTDEAGFLHHKFLCLDCFLLTDFVAPEGMYQNRLAVPCGLDSVSHSIPQSSQPLLPTLQLHVWLAIKWHYFQMATVLFWFELQQVISAIVYVYIYDRNYVPVPSLVTHEFIEQVCSTVIHFMDCEMVLTYCGLRYLALYYLQTNILPYWLVTGRLVSRLRSYHSVCT
jgi:hypothetical protein